MRSQSTPLTISFFLVLFFAFFIGVAPSAQSFAEANEDPVPSFSDDLFYKGLANSLEKSRDYFNEVSEQVFDLCGHSLTGQEISDAYTKTLQKLSEDNNNDLGHFFSENFSQCKPMPLLVTGYYTPIFSGSLNVSGKYRHPLYSPPDIEELRSSSRADIDTDNRLQGHEIVYLADPVDLFFLHVQGSGIIELPDGNRLLASYAGDNGRPYTSIGKILIQENVLSKEEVSLDSIRKYLSDNPGQNERILHHNERFIFFRLSTPKPNEFIPSGSLGCPLTPGRSVAMDNDHYPPGILGVLKSSQPVLRQDGSLLWQQFSRLVTHQDSGSAIKGAQRLDLYMGVGKDAGKKAGMMKEKGSFTILIPNLSFREDRSKIVASGHIGPQRKDTEQIQLVDKRNP